MESKTNRVYSVNQNDDGTFSFEHRKPRFSRKVLRFLMKLQPESTWLLVVDVETYKQFEKERNENLTDNL